MITPILQVKKLRHREVCDLPRTTQLASIRARIEPWLTAFIIHTLKCCALDELGMGKGEVEAVECSLGVRCGETLIWSYC